MDVEVDLAAELSRHFGFTGFRAGQEEVIRSALSGRSTVAVMPTGAGKSLCYQLPALLLPGTALIISPLVALMKDQVDALQARGVAATFVNSSIDDAEKARRLEAMRQGAFKLVYVAPERFRSAAFLESLRGLEVSLLAVDEAHCISVWGHDFRPDYTRLGQVRWELRPPRTLALTATATPEVRGDIVRVLRLKDPRVSVAGFDRENLFLEVARVASDEDKLARIGEAARDGGGVVYCATRKDVEKVAVRLRSRGLPALAYHAGMADEERRRVQDEFMGREEAIVAATNAFGMGVDKASIRFVAHFSVPRTVEAYYQEIGRAGRDGKPAHALLLFNHADVFLQERLIEGSHPTHLVIRETWEALCEAQAPLGEAELARELRAGGMEVGSALRQLERAGHVARSGSGYLALDRQTPAGELRVDFDQLRVRRAREQQLLKRMVSYAYHEGCRRSFLLAYFGDRATSCTGCDVCHGPRSRAAVGAVPPKRRRRGREDVATDGGGMRASEESPPRGGAALPAEDGAAPELQDAVFQALRRLRLTLAQAEAVPPFVVFHDKTLLALARALPRTEAGFLAIPGCGPSKWDRYGPHVLAAIAQVAGATGGA